MPLILLLWCSWAIPVPARAQMRESAADEYSNGAIQMTVEHAKPDPLRTRNGENLYGILTIQLRNISQETLKVVVGSPDCDFAIDIRDTDGRSPRPTRLGEHLPKSEAERAMCPVVSSSAVELPPGKAHTVRLSLRRLFELEPGHPYNIKVTWAKGLPAATPSGRQLRRELSRSVAIK